MVQLLAPEWDKKQLRFESFEPFLSLRAPTSSHSANSCLQAFRLWLYQSLHWLPHLWPKIRNQSGNRSLENAYQPRISFIGDCYRQLIVKHCSDVYPCLRLAYQRPRWLSQADCISATAQSAGWARVTQPAFLWITKRLLDHDLPQRSRALFSSLCSDQQQYYVVSWMLAIDESKNNREILLKVRHEKVLLSSWWRKPRVRRNHRELGTKQHKRISRQNAIRDKIFLFVLLIFFIVSHFQPAREAARAA